MAKGKPGYQSRRLRQKKEQERRRRKRQRRNKMIIQYGAVFVVLALIGGFALPALLAGKSTPKASATPKPSACTTPGAQTLGKKQFSNPPCMVIDPNKRYTAVVNTEQGQIRVNLLAKQAPITVNNFVFLARQKFYDGTPFHRVIPDFTGPGLGTDMIQGGDAVNKNGSGNPGYRFNDENLGPMNKPTAAMANSGANTNGSQFFFLDGPWKTGTSYNIFGEITAGLAVIKKIAHQPVTGDKPKHPVLIRSVTIEEK